MKEYYNNYYDNYNSVINYVTFTNNTPKYSSNILNAYKEEKEEKENTKE